MYTQAKEDEFEKLVPFTGEVSDELSDEAKIFALQAMIDFGVDKLEKLIEESLGEHKEKADFLDVVEELYLCRTTSGPTLTNLTYGMINDAVIKKNHPEYYTEPVDEKRKAVREEIMSLNYSDINELALRLFYATTGDIEKVKSLG